MTHYNLQIPPQGRGTHATGAGELVAATVLDPGLSTFYTLQQRLAPPPQGIILLTSCMGLNYYFRSSVTFNSANAILI